ncbi:MAG: YidC/Oxa1 family insertase periplasmic-domain containing protein [Planctomycetaceae bacterium]
MDNRRFITFLVFFFAFSYIYTGFILPKLFPPPPPVPVAESADKPDDAGTGEALAEAADGGSADASAVPEKPVEIPAHPEKSVSLGSLDPASGYFLKVDLTSAGAAVKSVQLTDPKFRDLNNRDQQVTVVGTNVTPDRTFSTAVKQIDVQLKATKQSLETIPWELVSANESEATFSFEAPDHTLKVSKTYRLHRIPGSADELKAAFLKDPAGYTIEVDLTVSNLSGAPLDVDYELQGPVGLILENEEHTRKFEDIKIEFLDDDSSVTLGGKALQKLYTEHLSVAEASGSPLTEAEVRDRLKQSDAWTGAFRYAAVDVQFFAALIATIDDRPEETRLTSKWIDRIYPVMVQLDSVDANLSDISFRMASAPLKLGTADGDSAVTHCFAFFVGPKRGELLDPPPLQAHQVLDYGSWFGFIARFMHWLLDTFHSWGMPYVLAIITLTALVRGCMFPISRKQAIMAAKQKALAPKINELKLKYGDDKEKLARAQMELWRKHGINPLGGCLPALIQLPVFIALYTCLNTAVDLRLSSFLWIDNLAAPDALARMPRLPLLGSDFNLLPCISVALFLVQQKLFMPPPQDEQAEMTAKMMNFMTIFMGVMFWHVPAGLCIYFIASSLWSIVERKMLASDKMSVESMVVVKETDGKSGAAAPRTGFFGKLMTAMEEAQRQAEDARKHAEKSNEKYDSKGGGNSKNGKNKKKGR